MSRILRIAMLAGGLALSGAAEAETIERFDADFWKGGAQMGDDGVLFDCYLRAEHLRDKYSIFLRYDGQGVHVSLYDETWSLPAGDEFRGRVRIDTRFDADLPGVVMGVDLVDYLIGFDEAAWGHIKSGRQITLEGPQGQLQFPLTGTKKAMNALLRCADKYYADAGPGAAPEPEPASEPVERVTATGSAENSMTGKGGVVPDAAQHPAPEPSIAAAPEATEPKRLTNQSSKGNVPATPAAPEAEAEAESVSAARAGEEDAGTVTATETPAPEDADALIQRALLIATDQQDGTPDEAFAAADRAAMLGDRRGHWLSGRFALAGYGTDMARPKALARILLAAEEGHPEAQTFLAYEYLQSDDPVRQLVGRDYLNQAAAQAHAPALAALRLMDAGEER